MASKIETELLTVTGQGAKVEAESFQDYLKRLLTASNGLPENKWAGLSAPTQGWFNDACAAMNSQKPIPNFADEDGSPTVSAPGTAPAPTATAAPVAATTPATTAHKAKRGGVKELKRLIARNPEWKKEQFAAELTNQGFEIGNSTLDSVIYDTKQTIEILREVGMIAAAPAA